MSKENERSQTHHALMGHGLEAVYYQVQAFRKSREDYSPYSYVEDGEDGDDPVFFDEQTLEEWDWE